jgi:hypothetical protein
MIVKKVITMGYAMGNVFKHLYNILKYIDKRKLYNYLFKNFNSNNLIIVTDINKMCLKLKENGNNIDIDGYKSIKEIHDDIYHQYRNMNIAKYEFDKVCFDNDSYEYESGSYRIEIPCNTDKLIEYSTKLKNCISSYNRKFHNLNCVLLAVYVDNVLKYNIELVKNDKDNYTLKQFLGIKNNKPDKKDLLVVTNILKDLEIKTKNQPITTNII